jgi:hypothetical protein
VGIPFFEVFHGFDGFLSFEHFLVDVDILGRLIRAG